MRFLAENAFKRHKKAKMGVFRSQSGTTIVSETRPFYIFFCAFKRVSKNSYLLG